KISFPSIAALALSSVAVMIAALPYRGLMLPLLSSEPRTRLISLGSIISGLLVLCYGLSTIAAEAQFFQGPDMPLEIRQLYITSELITILVSVLITTIGLRSAHYYGESIFYAEQERQAAEREGILRRIIQAVRGSLNLEDIFQ